jgi:hypothetical protein
MAFGKKSSSGEMRGKREKSDKAMRGKMPKQADAKPAAKKAAPKGPAKQMPMQGKAPAFPFAGGGAPMQEMQTMQMQPADMGRGRIDPMGGGGGMLGAGAAGAGRGPRGPVGPVSPSMGASAIGAGMMGGMAGGAPSPRSLPPGGPAVSGPAMPPGAPRVPQDLGSGQLPPPKTTVNIRPPQDLNNGRLPPRPIFGGSSINPMLQGSGDQMGMASGGSVGDALRKFVGMPSKRRGDQLERQEQEILNPPSDTKKK